MKIAIKSWIIFVMLLACSAIASSAAKKPNVLFIALDDLNVWVTHLGRNLQAQTPNIDRLASQGVTFAHAYAAVPACEPSRAALMSGLRPWNSACYKNGDNWKQEIPEGIGLTGQFIKAGYYVAGAGKIYHSDTYYASEWSEYMDETGFDTHGKGVSRLEGFLEPLQHDLKDEDLMDWHTINWCIERLKQKRDKPFFIACGLHKPHLPFAVPRKYYNQFPLDQIQLPPYLENDLDDIPSAGVAMALSGGDHQKILKSNRWKDAIQSYLAACAYTDMNVGRLLDALAQSPEKGNTIVVLWGDHGWSFGEKNHWRKFALWEEPTRAPLIWVAPGVTRPGGVCARTVDFMTIYPTLCDLAGIPTPKHVEGLSMVSLLRDPNAAWSLPAITTQGYQNHTVRTEQWRYIRYADGGEELYDEQKDPYEWVNLAGKGGEYNIIKNQLFGYLPTSVKPPVKEGSGKEE
jgi:arylsulfatase A-like enzyme